MILNDLEAHAAEDMSGLTEGEQLVVRSWRRVAAERIDGPLLAREFERACGEDAAEVFATFCTFLRALACASRRHLRIGHPGCSTLTLDERQLLTVIAAAQAGDETRLEANLRWLARAELRVALAIAVSALGTALAAHGYCLPLPVPVARSIATPSDPIPAMIRARIPIE